MSENLLTVASFSTALEAQLAKGKLEASGIMAMIFDEHIINTNWLYSNLVGGVKVKVRESDFAEAREILKAEHGKGEEVEALGVCPRCGNTNPEYSIGKLGLILTWILLGVPLFPIRKRLKCNKCGNQWKPEKLRW